MKMTKPLYKIGNTIAVVTLDEYQRDIVHIGVIDNIVLRPTGDWGYTTVYFVCEESEMMLYKDFLKDNKLHKKISDFVSMLKSKEALKENERREKKNNESKVYVATKTEPERKKWYNKYF